MNTDMDVSVVIPTYNRPQDLKKCLQSILYQTVLPKEIIVIDDGELKECPYRQDFEKKGVQYIFRQKKDKGLTRSRNLGVRIASEEIVAFFDDDVILEPDYIEEIKRVYDSNFDPHLGGISGIVLNVAKPTIFTYLEYFYNILFLISPVRPGGVTWSGFSEQILIDRTFPPKQLTKADILGGCLFSFHRKVFHDFMFSEEYEHNYCQGEDKDFSMRVSTKYNLYINPKAKLYHFESPIERVNKYRRGRDYILSVYNIFYKYKKRNIYEFIFFFFSFYANLLKKSIAAFLKMDISEKDRIKGMIDASRIIMKSIKDNNLIDDKKSV